MPRQSASRRRLVTLLAAAAAILGAIALLRPAPQSPDASGAPAPTIATIVGERPIPGAAPRISALAPDFTWREPDGSLRALSDLRGRPAVVNFWATWCVPCRTEMPAFERVAETTPDVTFLMIDLQEDAPQVRAFFDRFELRRLKPLIDPDGAIARRYGLAALPMTFFVDRQGVSGISRSGALSTRSGSAPV